MSQQYTTADLTSVLATLSALSNQQPQPYSQNTPGPEPEDNDTYEPSETIIPINPHLTPTPASQPKPHSQPQPQPPKPNPERPNTSTITAWPPALKSVMRTVSQNEDLQRKIRWLIQRQHDHEKQWWEGREALVKKQKARGEKKKELDAVLRSVGAPVDGKEISTAEEDRAELASYDMKVYKASRQMADAMMGELRALQIPFFSIKQSLILNPLNPVGIAGQQGVGKDELAVLRRRMLELLRDLCKE